MRADLDTAADLITEAFRIAGELGAERLVLHAGLTVAQLPPNDRLTGAPDLERLLDLAARLGDQRMQCVVQVSIGIEAMLAGRIDEAASGFRRAFAAARDSGYWHATGFSLMCCAALAAVVGDTEACARLHGASLEAQPVLRRGMPPAYHALYEEFVRDAAAALGPDRFERLAADTAALGWDHAVLVAGALLDRLSPVASAEHRAPASLAAARPPARPRLTDRELQVLACIAAGDTNKDVARRLSITPKTVMHHTTSIYRKLGVRGRAEAAAIGLREGLIAP
jgi:DNA-binding CsgD family transcriptional regulator